jgi:hypothetical protein
MTDPVGARRKALSKLRLLEDLDDPESLVVPILIDAILMAESYRGARHEITFLNELTRNVDALIREINAAEKARSGPSRSTEPRSGVGQSVSDSKRSGNQLCSAADQPSMSNRRQWNRCCA